MRAMVAVYHVVQKPDNCLIWTAMKKTHKIALLCFAIFSGACSDTPMSTVPDMGVDLSEDMAVTEDMSQLSQVGEVCNGPRDCVENALCVGVQSGGFRCMAECGTKYSLCDEGVCLPLTPRPESICYIGGTAEVGESCVTNLDCSPGNLCIGTGDNFLCTDACDAEHPCGSDQHCRLLDTGASICSKNVGEVCDSGIPCADPSLVCTADVSIEYRDFLGLDVCTWTACTTCPDGALCLGLSNAPDTMCLGTCETDADCQFAVGWTCRGLETCSGFADPEACRLTLGSQSVCVPPPN